MQHCRYPRRAVACALAFAAAAGAAAATAAAEPYTGIEQATYGFQVSQYYAINNNCYAPIVMPNYGGCCSGAAAAPAHNCGRCGKHCCMSSWDGYCNERAAHGPGYGYGGCGAGCSTGCCKKACRTSRCSPCGHSCGSRGGSCEWCDADEYLMRNIPDDEAPLPATRSPQSDVTVFDGHAH